MSAGIAIVGMACVYPEARSPAQLWDNVLAQRRAFRRIPAERLPLQDYGGADPDRTYATHAAVIENPSFDRARFQVSGETHRAVDPAHWLALECAADAIADAGYGNGDGLPLQTTGVLVGNTLTGEYTRASGLRLRWPYVKRVLESTLDRHQVDCCGRETLIGDVERTFKAPFPLVGAESLAGWLSNTIAGRICNHFDLHGGGYTVDGACASSLLAVTNACSALAAGDLDVAVAGGVDISLDPFELVGFARAGALATGDMRVFDRHSSGFWPGEGCGFVVLMTTARARREHRRIHAIIRGWGISSDGAGGMTRPEIEGQVLALRRAYMRAGYPASTVGYFEAHGTGTPVGDGVELQAIARARQQNGSVDAMAAIGSIKANIGHTKAAAGMAGLIKAIFTVREQVLPPTTGCLEPRADLLHAGRLEVLDEGREWPADVPLRAGVSALGFGGINTHLTIEANTRARKRRAILSDRDRISIQTPQDAELLLFADASADGLAHQLEQEAERCTSLTRGQLADYAALLAGRTTNGTTIRAALIAADPDAAERVAREAAMLVRSEPNARLLDARRGIFVGMPHTQPRVTFLFPGQASLPHLGGGVWARRFPRVRAFYTCAPATGDLHSTTLAQPEIVRASLACLDLLEHHGVTASAAVGHSLGELTALAWAGSLDRSRLVDIAATRATVMTAHATESGAMLSLEASAAAARELLVGGASVACMNSRNQTVVAGSSTDIEATARLARARGIAAVRLPVTLAFHSPSMRPAMAAFREALGDEPLQSPNGRVHSTIAGRTLCATDDVREMLARQFVSPVRFVEALTAAAAETDLFIEVGPGSVLSHLASACTSIPAVATDAGSKSLRGLLCALGAAFAAGVDIDAARIFEGRHIRPLTDRRPTFYTSLCESALLPEAVTAAPVPAAGHIAAALDGDPGSDASALDHVVRLVAARTELPRESVHPYHRMLSDLHLNSITVTQIVAEAARALDAPPLRSPSEFANARVSEIAAALEIARTVSETGPAQAAWATPGVDGWVRAYQLRDVKAAPAPPPRAGSATTWHVHSSSPRGDLSVLHRELVAVAPTRGTAFVLTGEPNDADLAALLAAARDAAVGSDDVFLLVTCGRAGVAIAKTLQLERRDLAVAAIDVPFDNPNWPAWAAREAAGVKGFVEVRYGDNGERLQPRLSLLDLTPAGPLPLDERDTLLVTGGARGITAECALAVALRAGAALAMVGRSSRDDERVQATLRRMRAAGVQAHYEPADIGDPLTTRDAIRRLEAAAGPITAILHGAAVNEPALLPALGEPDLMQALRPKVHGLANVLASLPDLSRLRLLCAFGSITARTGMRGEAHYAAANERLAGMVDAFGASHPDCRCLTIEWSVWAGAGMGERLERLSALEASGTLPIGLEQGTAMLLQLLQSRTPSSVVVTGRLGALETLMFDQPQLPLRRFLETPRVHYAGVELVSESVLDVRSDPYLDDHVLDGRPLLPAVIGLEAMATAALALVPASGGIQFRDVRFDRPVFVPRDGSRRVRVAALVAGDEARVVLRSDETAFHVDHFSCRVGSTRDRAERVPWVPGTEAGSPPVEAATLYGPLLFQRGAFQRLRGYWHLTADTCIAELDGGAAECFGAYLPQTLVLGNPGVRDAAIHCIQATIPDIQLIPERVQSIDVFHAPEDRRLFVHARQRSEDRERHVFDLVIADASGTVCERWHALTLKRIGAIAWDRTLPAQLLGPLLERQLRRRGFPPCRAVLRVGTRDRERDADAVRALIGETAAIARREDGRPFLLDAGPWTVSISHAEPVTLVLTGVTDVGCDVEPVVDRSPRTWRDLLGSEYALAELVAIEANEPISTAASRVWSAREAQRKIAIRSLPSIVLGSAASDGVVVFSAGDVQILTMVRATREHEAPLAVAAAAIIEAAAAHERVRADDVAIVASHGVAP